MDQNKKGSTQNGKLGICDYKIPKKRLLCKSKTIAEIFWVKGRHLSGRVKISLGEWVLRVTLTNGGAVKIQFSGILTLIR